ncbi:MAG TPA: hypothetical protein VGN16_14700 [Acidobacteriaceae bacterium]|jgi:hypothetical protein
MRRHAVRDFHRSAFRVGLTWLCLFGPALAQEQASAGDTVYHLHGVVLNAVTGQPIARALVQTQDRRLATMTDSEGKFAVDIFVPPPAKAQEQSAFVGYGYGYGLGFGASVNIFLVARKPGYIEPRIMGQPIPLNDALSSTNIELKLQPAAAIEGQISVRGADVPRNIGVMLMAHVMSDGSLVWTMRGQQVTNSRGEFRFSSLQPGEYTLMTMEWHDEQAGPRPPPGVVSEQYQPLFLGDVSDAAAATKLQLHSGRTTRVEFHLEPAPFYPVTIPVANPPGSVNAQVLNNGMFAGYQFRYDSRLQTVEASLPRGTYDVLISSFGQPNLVAELPVHVEGAPVRLAPVTLSPVVNIPVQVRTEFTNDDQQQAGQGMRRGPSFSGAPRTPPVNIYLRSDSGMSGGSAGMRQPDGSVVLQNVMPGTFHVVAQVYNAYIASMTSGGVDLTQRPLVVASGSSPEPIEIVLRNDMASLTGTVSGLGESSSRPEAVVMFIPTDASGRFQQTYVRRDDKFAMNNLAPGSYRVLAFRDIRSQLAYRDEATMRRFEGKGATVTVAAGQSAQADVAVLDSPEVDEP